MTGPAGGGRLPRWTSSVHAVDSATSAVRAEAARLQDGLPLAVAALTSIEERAKTEFHRSARVASLGFDSLPPGYYLAHLVGELRAELQATRLVGGSLRRVRGHIAALRELYERVVEFTAGVDVAGELDLPLEIVSTAQTGARSGLSSLDRMSRAIAALSRDDGVTGRPAAGVDHPSPTAQRLLNTSSRLLPAASRDRFAEEFRSELFSLAESGAGLRAQLAYVLRQSVQLWALRRALPRARPVRGDEGGRVPTALRSDRGAVVRTYLLDHLRKRVDDRLAVELLRSPRRKRSRPVYRRGSRGAPGLAQAGRPSAAFVGDLPTLREPARHRRTP